MIGFGKNDFLKTNTTDIILQNINNNDVLVSEDLINIFSAKVKNKDIFNVDICLYIEFDNTSITCSEFASFYSINDQKFILAYNIKKDTVLKGYNNNFKVKKLKLIYNTELIQLSFDKNYLFYINDILCHNYEDFSLYEQTLKANDELIENDMSQIYKLIRPNKEDFSINFKYLNSKWKEGNLLLDRNFEKNTTGYDFNNQISIKICNDTIKLKEKYLLFNCFGYNIKINPNCKTKYSNHLGQSFLVYDLNDLIDMTKEVNALEFTFSSDKESTVSNCVILSQREYKYIADYFQGLLTLNQ